MTFIRRHRETHWPEIRPLSHVTVAAGEATAAKRFEASGWQPSCNEATLHDADTIHQISSNRWMYLGVRVAGNLPESPISMFHGWRSHG
ncbi:hypothetical protein [Lysobacter sp. A378]